ncbi:MAG: hypothetical protein KVP17_003526 [Porospora cf. gigantea B]|uniref:uncharacterized protein n=1 Tax=Porospora cf. gigantea B TaxID=2853592 RepID=UPI003571C097|nr:MAG: hypothetical protein KVP17_003526 [Porospora cf. gigantea B]
MTLSHRQRNILVGRIKDAFEGLFRDELKLDLVSGPLFLSTETGLNDELNGIERPVSFETKDGQHLEIVQSLAKWKRRALYNMEYPRGEGLVTRMKAVRRDEDLDATHSFYVVQWDWEKVIQASDRSKSFLVSVASQIYGCLLKTRDAIAPMYTSMMGKEPLQMAPNLFFITTQELHDTYPSLTPKEREREICKEYGAVFLMKIGGTLADGSMHDGRASDYDDWNLNGDILVWNPVLDNCLELSSMGIRVDAASLKAQMMARGEDKRFEYHQAILADTYPLTIGGGIGQDRVTMYLAQLPHVGQVQVSSWGTCVSEEETKEFFT